MNMETCQDHHVCRNGGSCVRHPELQGLYTCDCTTAASGIYAGLSCDHAATTFCNSEDIENPISFCTNKGVCLETWDENGPHVGCECPKGYKGDYCELVEGQSTPAERASTPTAMSREPLSKGSQGSNQAVVIAGVLGALAATVLIVALFVVLKRRRNGEQHTVSSPKSIRQADSTQLDHDGDVLRSSLHATQSGEMLYSSASNLSRDSRGSRRKLDTTVDLSEHVEFGQEIPY